MENQTFNSTSEDDLSSEQLIALFESCGILTIQPLMWDYRDTLFDRASIKI